MDNRYSGASDSDGIDKPVLDQLLACAGSDDRGLATMARPTGSKGPRSGGVVKSKSADRRSGDARHGGAAANPAKASEPATTSHIRMERERRRKMRSMFATLRALLPKLPAKVEKSVIVEETVNCIRSLELTLQGLQKRKLEETETPQPLPATMPAQRQAPAPRLPPAGRDRAAGRRQAITPVAVPADGQRFRTWASPGAVMSVSGNDAHISICAAKKPDLLSAVLEVLEEHKLEVVTAQISSDHLRSLLMIHVHADGSADRLPETGAAEEDVFTSAIGEIKMLLQA